MPPSTPANWNKEILGSCLIKSFCYMLRAELKRKPIDNILGGLAFKFAYISFDHEAFEYSCLFYQREITVRVYSLEIK